METIFHKKVSWKIVAQFINNPSQQYTFSDLLRQTRSGPTNVKKAIDELKEKNFLTSRKEGNKIWYRANLKSYFVRSLFVTYAWDKVNKFPKNVAKCLQVLTEKLISANAISVCLFGSAVYKARPNDFDLAVVYSKGEKELEKIWLETIKDFEENIELHFFQKKEFISLFQDGDYRITSTVSPCLILYDHDFLLNYLGKIPPPGKKLLAKRIKSFEGKLGKCFQLYRKKRNDCEELVKNILPDFLRIYIGYKKEIPGSKHILTKQAKRLGLVVKKRNLWERLEWMERTIKQMKRNM